MAAIATALKALNRLECFLAAFGLLVVAAILLADVLGREVFGSGIYWAPRLASYFTTVAGMLGFSIVVSAGGHLRPKFVDGVFPESWDTTVNRIADLLSAGLLFFLFWHSALFVWSTAELGTRAIALNFPVWIVQAIVPYVFLSAAIRYLFYAFAPAFRPKETGFGE